MALTEQLRKELDELVHSHEVVLFMKGTPERPQCGFSATVAGVLDGMIDGYHTVNVLERADLREGIKEYGNWPTIPQLYVKGELVGGADIVKNMAQKGELAGLLGVKLAEVTRPNVTVTPAAVEQLAKALADSGEGNTVRFSVDRRFQSALDLDEAGPDDFVYTFGSIKLAIDRGSAPRSDGVIIDFVSRGLQSGFKIDNPHAPPSMQLMSARELKAKLDAKTPLVLLDVRTKEERETALIAGARQLDEETDKFIKDLPKDTVLVFHCHHGGRSAAAAQHYLSLGFKNVFNLEGGIAAWSRDVDPSVAQY